MLPQPRGKRMYIWTDGLTTGRIYRFATLGLVWKKLNLLQQKHALTNQKKCTTTQNKHKKTKAGLSRLLRHLTWKRSGFFLKQLRRKQVRKKWRKKTSGEAWYKQANNIQNQKWNQGGIMPRSPHRAGKGWNDSRNNVKYTTRLSWPCSAVRWV